MAGDAKPGMVCIVLGMVMMRHRCVDDKRGSRCRNARRDSPRSAQGEHCQGRCCKSNSPEQGKHRHPTKLRPRPENHTVEQKSRQYGDAPPISSCRLNLERLAPSGGLHDGELCHHSRVFVLENMAMGHEWMILVGPDIERH